MRYSDIEIGMIKEINHLITQEDVNKFADLTGDDNKLHLDEKFASKTSFKKPVAHGMLSASFISTIIGTEIPGDGALWFSQTIDFLIPVRVGDLITVKAKVLKKDDRNNTIEMSTDIYNQNKEQVLRGTAKVKIIEPVKVEVENKIIKKEKYALVIGATGGIGSETCMKLASSGFNIIIHYHRNKEKALNIKKKVIDYGMNAYVFKADINEKKEVDSMFLSIKNRIPYINTFVNCGTIRLPSISFENLDWLEIENNININLKSNFFIVKNLLPIFKSQKKGKIIFISTLYTEGSPPQGMLAYVSAKSALNGFSKSLAIELAKYNITVNMVSPGMTDTDLISNVPEKYKMLMAAKTPLKRLSSVTDVAEAIVFLSSDGANYITGETIRVNGGQIMI
tara:strand:- start:3863 stop:5047 length:1185 start_codon:yes stop_codon:yes gene_type:complete